MNIIESVRNGFKRVFDYKTRSSRSEYWWFLLAFIGWALLPIIIGIAEPSLFELEHESPRIYQASLYVWLLGFIAFMIAGLPLCIRRLNDVDLSFRWMLVIYVPFGIFYFLYLMSRAGTSGHNQFGPNPLLDKIEMSN